MEKPNSSIKSAIYPGTFDPITSGHIDIIKRASNLFDRLIVAVAYDACKNTLFSLEERVSIANAEILALNIKNVEVMQFHGLLVEFASSQNATVIVRGLRALADFEYEFRMSYINHKLHSKVETIFLPATEQGHFISATFVKEIARLKGNLTGLVSDYVAKKLRRHYDQV